MFSAHAPAAHKSNEPGHIGTWIPKTRRASQRSLRLLPSLSELELLLKADMQRLAQHMHCPVLVHP